MGFELYKISYFTLKVKLTIEADGTAKKTGEYGQQGGY